MNTQLGILCDAILEAGRKRFGAMLGIVSHIHNASYDVVAVSSLTGIPKVGDAYPLDAVYCREVFQTKRTVALTEINGVPGMRLHPLYDTVPCEFYISSPIFVEGEVWGTLNFTSLEMRDVPFSNEDIIFMEELANSIGNAMGNVTPGSVAVP